MRSSLVLYWAEVGAYTVCLIMLFAKSTSLLRHFIVEDLEREGESESLYRYSSIVTIAASLLFVLIVFRLSERIDVQLFFDQEGGEWRFWLSLPLGGIVGFFWMHMILKRYASLQDDFIHRDAEIFGRNSLIFIVTTSFFSLLLASPALLSEPIDDLRHVALVAFLGMAFRYAWGQKSMISIWGHSESNVIDRIDSFFK